MGGSQGEGWESGALMGVGGAVVRGEATLQKAHSDLSLSVFDTCV